MRSSGRRVVWPQSDLRCLARGTLRGHVRLEDDEPVPLQADAVNWASFVQRRPIDLDALTDREVEVLRLVARGMSNAEIAQQVIVGVATAKTHVSRLLMKLDARDRAQLVVAAYESGLVAPGSA